MADIRSQNVRLTLGNSKKGNIGHISINKNLYRIYTCYGELHCLQNFICAYIGGNFLGSALSALFQNFLLRTTESFESVHMETRTRFAPQPRDPFAGSVLFGSGGSVSVFCITNIGFKLTVSTFVASFTATSRTVPLARDGTQQVSITLLLQTYPG
jgi:hypothetical protein